MKKTKVTVIGSLNMDLVTQIPVIPGRGETKFGTHFATSPGGKGANQAVACARLGADVTMIGCVGDDDFGHKLIQNLDNETINTDHVQTVAQENTGIASIIVEDKDNRIIVASGANERVTPEKIQQAAPAIQAADVILIQLEIPHDAVTMAIQMAKHHETPVILNPAPAVQLDPALIQDTTYLTPNEHELAVMLGHPQDETNIKTDLKRYPEKIVLTKGSEGAYYATHKGESKMQPAFSVEAVDTTGAGDTFNAGLAVLIGEGKKLKQAVAFATCAGTLSVTKHGAQEGMPYRKDVEAWVTDT